MAKTEHRTFSRSTEVSVDIDASAEQIWALITDSSEYPKWTSTVLSIDGEIAPGQTIKLKSQLDPKRTFKLRVKEFQPPTRLAWGDAIGTRTYELSQRPAGGVSFSMKEKIGGPLFPLFARMIPSFDDSFDRFAADLKRAAEARK